MTTSDRSAAPDANQEASRNSGFRMTLSSLMLSMTRRGISGRTVKKAVCLIRTAATEKKPARKSLRGPLCSPATKPVKKYKAITAGSIMNNSEFEASPPKRGMLRKIP